MNKPHIVGPDGLKRLPIVYIAGPISNGDQMTNVAHAMRIWEALRSSGKVVPFCPHWSALQQMFCPISHADWLALDKQLILRFDAVLRLGPGCFSTPVELPPSDGADDEVAFAVRHGIPVFHRIYTDPCDPEKVGVVNWAAEVWGAREWIS